MFEKIIKVQPLNDFILRATFKDGCVKASVVEKEKNHGQWKKI